MASKEMLQVCYFQGLSANDDFEGGKQLPLWEAATPLASDSFSMTTSIHTFDL